MNSEKLKGAIGISLFYKQVNKHTKQRRSINFLPIYIRVDLYNKKNVSIPDCRLKKHQIHDELILNEFSENFQDIIDSTKENNQKIVLNPANPETINLDIPVISNFIVLDDNNQFKLTQFFLTSFNNNFLKSYMTVDLFSKSLPNDSNIFENIWLGMIQEKYRKNNKIFIKFFLEFCNQL